jgi:hypothetical protein
MTPQGQTTELARGSDTVTLGEPQWMKYIMWATILSVIGFAAMRYKKKMQLKNGVV